jgi:hypothetical protein
MAKYLSTGAPLPSYEIISHAHGIPWTGEGKFAYKTAGLGYIVQINYKK